MTQVVPTGVELGGGEAAAAACGLHSATRARWHPPQAASSRVGQIRVVL